MKKNFIYLSIAAVALVLAACSKDNSNNTTTTTQGTITLGGTVYKQNQGVFQTSSLNGKSYATFGAAGTNGSKRGVLLFYFAGSSKPAAGTYAIKNDATDNFTGNVVSILAGDSTGVSHDAILSAQDGKSISVAVSSSGKLTITLSGVSFKGTNLDHSNPNDTASSDITETGSATVNEQ